jgi:hypothetical protein
LVIEDIIHLAKYSELSSIAIKEDTVAILSFINLGMVELYKRFALKRKTYIITINVEDTLYSMPVDFMYPTSAFKKVLQGTKLVNEDVPINEELSYYSVFFPTYNQIQVPESLETTELTLLYVPKPIRYTIDNLQVDIDLPEVLIDCLLSYIGYKGHLGVRSDGQSENNYHSLRFERSVLKAKELGVCPSTDYFRTTNKLNLKGFV